MCFIEPQLHPRTGWGLSDKPSASNGKWFSISSPGLPRNKSGVWIPALPPSSVWPQAGHWASISPNEWMNICAICMHIHRYNTWKYCVLLLASQGWLWSLNVRLSDVRKPQRPVQPEVLLLIPSACCSLLLGSDFVAAPAPWHESVISVSKAGLPQLPTGSGMDYTVQFISSVCRPPPPTLPPWAGWWPRKAEAGVNERWILDLERGREKPDRTSRRGRVSCCFLFVHFKANRCSEQSSDSDDQQHFPRGCPAWEASVDASQKAMTQWTFSLSWRRWHGPKVRERQSEC